MGGGSSITPSSSGEIYSTDETAIGTWIDGKTLYRKVFTNVSSGFNIGLTDSNANIVNLYGHAHDANNRYNIPYADNNYYIGCYLNRTTGVVIFGNVTVDCIIIEYTKVTT